MKKYLFAGKYRITITYPNSPLSVAKWLYRILMWAHRTVISSRSKWIDGGDGEWYAMNTVFTGLTAVALLCLMFIPVLWIQIATAVYFGSILLMCILLPLYDLFRHLVKVSPIRVENTEAPVSGSYSYSGGNSWWTENLGGIDPYTYISNTIPLADRQAIAEEIVAKIASLDKKTAALFQADWYKNLRELTGAILRTYLVQSVTQDAVPAQLPSKRPFFGGNMLSK